MSAYVPDLSSPQGVVDALLFHGVKPAVLRGVTDGQLDDAYGRAYQAISEGRHADALDDAVFLVSNDPWARHHHLALACCLQHLGQHESAGRFYAQAFLMDATDALCVYRLGECLGALGDLPEAREAFEAAVKLSWQDPEQVTVREQAQARLDQLVGMGA